MQGLARGVRGLCSSAQEAVRAQGRSLEGLDPDRLQRSGRKQSPWRPLGAVRGESQGHGLQVELGVMGLKR